MKRFIFLFPVLIINTGCAVVGIESNASRTIKNPDLTTERAKLNCDTLDEPKPRSLASLKVSGQQLEKAWGKPDKIRTTKEGEKWTYKGSLRWNGMWALVMVVPVPLVIPTGHNSMDVNISNGYVSSVDLHYPVDRELGCGFVFIHGGGWYCSDGKLNHAYGLRTAFCGYGKLINASNAN